MGPAILISLAALLVIATPIAVALIGASAVSMAIFTPLPKIIVVQQLYSALDKFPLAAIPFFILSGNIMSAGGLSKRLVEFALSLVGNIRGGLPASCIITCMIFAAVSGSSVATTFAVGAIVIPTMMRSGYPVGWAASLQATSAELGVIIPPSIPMIIFGLSANVSIGELFIAGILPGILIGATLIGFVLVWSIFKGYGKNAGSAPSIFPATRRAFWPLLMPVIVLGGIYGGVFTPTEASIVAVLFSLIISTLVYRSVTLKALFEAFRQSVMQSCGILFIIAAAGLFGFLITRAGIPSDLSAWLANTFTSQWSFLLAINIALLIVGMFIETSAGILMLAPILTPIAITMGIDPVHFGIIMIVNLAVGMITPPFGVNLFAASIVSGVPVSKMIPHLIPLVSAMLACLTLIVMIPWITLVLRDLVYS